MQVLLQILNTVGPKSTVPDSIFGTVGSLANALEEDFGKYMDSFVPFLCNALQETGLCAMAIGCLSDVARSVGELCQPYCDTFMKILTGCNAYAHDQLKPAILQSFSDIAQAIGSHFEKYLETVARVLDAAAGVTRGGITRNEINYEHLDYLISLSEGIMDAWGGIILALKQSKGIHFAKAVDILLSGNSASLEARRAHYICVSPMTMTGNRAINKI